MLFVTLTVVGFLGSSIPVGRNRRRITLGGMARFLITNLIASAIASGLVVLAISLG